MRVDTGSTDLVLIHGLNEMYTVPFVAMIFVKHYLWPSIFSCRTNKKK